MFFIKKIKNPHHLESSIDNNDMEYGADDIIIIDYFDHLKSLEFSKATRSEYEKQADFKQDVVEVFGKNCCIPIIGYSSLKCNNYLKGKYYKDSQNLSEMKLDGGML